MARGQSKGVVELAGDVGICSHLSFCLGPITSLGLTFKFKTRLSCKSVCVRTAIWMNLCHLWSVHMDSFIINTLCLCKP